jgi:hypothetical protein
MCWPNVVVRAQMKRVAGDFTFDIRKKIFVGHDVESRGPALPFDFECSTRVDLGERTNRSVIRFDVAIPSNANPSTSSGQSDADGQKYNRDLLHVKYGFSSYDASTPRFGFKEIAVMQAILPATRVQAYSQTGLSALLSLHDL